MYNKITDLSVHETEEVSGGYVDPIWMANAIGELAADVASSAYETILDVGKSIGEAIGEAAGGGGVGDA